MATSQALSTVDNIARVQELLIHDIERVNDLKVLLAAAEKQVEQRKQELGTYQKADPHAVGPTSINDCPSELLSSIFKLSIPEDASIQHTGRLLRVCKRWHTLIVNDPNMWNCIPILPPDQWDILSWSRSIRSYLKLCVERSRASRLNIEIDFSILKSSRRRLAERFHSGFFHFPSISKVEEDEDILYEWLWNLDYYDLDSGSFQTSTDCSPQHAVDLIGVLTEPDVIQRWESLTIWFPNNEVAEEVWESIAPHASGLSRLHLVGFGWETLRDGYGLDDDDDEAHLYIPSWAVPQIKDLNMKTILNWENFLSFEPSSLQKLTVDLTFEEQFFAEIARFSQLQTLTLTSPRIHEDIEIDVGARNRLSLPTLEHLVLIGEFHYLDTVKFDLPNLKQLRMEAKFPIATQPIILMIQPSEVHWAPCTLGIFLDDVIETAGKDIRGFFLSYVSSDHFSVSSFLKEEALKVVKELSTEGVLPPGWKTVSFHDAYGGVETKRIADIVSSDQDVDMLPSS